MSLDSQTDFCRRKRISEQALGRWRQKYGGFEVVRAKRKVLEVQNAKLKVGQSRACEGADRRIKALLSRNGKPGAGAGGADRATRRRRDRRAGHLSLVGPLAPSVVRSTHAGCPRGSVGTADAGSSVSASPAWQL